MGRTTRTLRHVPRLASGTIDRPRLRARLDGSAPLVVLRGRGGTGKTTLLAQWVRTHASDQGAAVLWMEADDSTRSRTGFWMRVLGSLHAQRLIGDAELYREAACVADRPDAIVRVLLRILGAQERAVTLVLDDAGSGGRDRWWSAVCEDLVEIMRRAPQLRCVVASRRRTDLEGASARAALTVDVLDDDDLALDDAEVAALILRTAPELPAGAAHALGLQLAQAGRAARRVSTVRIALDAVQRTRDQPDSGPPPRIDHLLEEVARHALHDEFPDPDLRDFLLLIARAPMVDTALAARLGDRTDAVRLLETLDAAGAGSWEETPGRGAPVFRFGAHLRADALAQPVPVDPARARALHREIALWLGARREHLTAFEHALRAEDLVLAESLLLRSCPLNPSESAHVAELLHEVPAFALHARPVLALWYGLSLSADPTTQLRAVPFLVSATGMCRRSAAAPEVGPAICEAFESVAHRFLGHRKTMHDLCRHALPALEQRAEDPDRDRALDALLLTAIGHCALGLFCAEDYERARRARQLQLRLAERQDRHHQRHEALAHLALIGAATGEFSDAAQALARIRQDDGVGDHGGGGAEAAERIARAWGRLGAGQAHEALCEVERAEECREGQELWDLVLTVETLALVMIDRAHDAEEHLHRVIRRRTSMRTLPSTRRRLRVVAGLVQLATGRLPEVPSRRHGAEESPALHALAALSALGAGDPREAVARLGEARLAAATPLQRMIIAAATTVVAADPACGIDLEESVLRMTAILRDSQVAWPVALLPGAVRRRAREVPSARDALDAAFALIPPLRDVPVQQLRPQPRLTEREHEILLLLLETEHRAEIAERLFVSVNTVKSQLRSLYGKLDVSTRDQALSRALELGLLHPMELAGGRGAP